MRDARPPLCVQILSISCSFWENLAKLRVHAPPLEGSRPPLGEILDPSLLLFYKRLCTVAFSIRDNEYLRIFNFSTRVTVFESHRIFFLKKRFLLFLDLVLDVDNLQETTFVNSQQIEILQSADVQLDQRVSTLENGSIPSNTTGNRIQKFRWLRAHSHRTKANTKV